METIDSTIQISKRPTFLTVLCILTFIGSSYGIFSGVTSYATADTVGVIKDKLNDSMDEISSDEPGAEMAQDIMDSVMNGMTADNIRKNAIASFIGNILTLLGGILMFGLKKMGFYSYLIGTIVLIAGPVAIFGGNFMGIIASGGIALFGILFVVLYAVNLKHMNK
jgi:hypothetical protein